jgi:hypothetical protein
MTRNIRFNSLGLSTLTVVLAISTGCGSPKPTEVASRDATQRSEDSSGAASPNKSSSSPDESENDHEHLPGAHGGIMISLGRDSYHVEAVVESAGKIRLYTLGKDESRVIEVDAQTLNGFVKEEGGVDSTAMTFEPAPQDGDTEGKTSLFIGQLPSEFIGKKLDVTVPNIRIDGERFRLGFVTGQDEHSDSPEMPDKIADQAERDLYLTPGGRYTVADIQANGNVTASEKFKGIKSEHDMKPKVGDMLCPITSTKANAKFTWIIDGKAYQFCCPPCIDEYINTAKTSAEPLPDPESFIKR